MVSPTTTRTRQAASAPAGDEDLLKVEEAAGRMGISKRYLYELIERDLVTVIRLPSTGGQRGHIRIEPAEVRRFIAAHRVPAAAAR